MCGIVGYIGPKNCTDIIINGLDRLEYRGYDSAGICINQLDTGLKIHKVTGKLQNLRKNIEGKDLHSNIGIGHTRWATHGSVINENAHPHGDQDVAVVHNGIIENAFELKTMLISEGYKFASDTDTEVFFVLIGRYLRLGFNLQMAVSEAFTKIRGNSAFVVIDKSGEKIVTVKRGAPLVCGDNSEVMEAYVSSDPYALAGYADTLYFPDDEVVCILSTSPTRIKTYELNGNESDRVVIRQQLIKSFDCDKGHFEHYMLKEIHEQPVLIRNWLNYYLDGDGNIELDEIKNFKGDHIHIVACGTAWHAGLIVKKYLEKYPKIQVCISLASEFRYADPLLSINDWAIFISQSGETADTLAAQKLCKNKGLTTISIVNVQGSTLYRHCTKNLLIKAGMEIGVASTKAFTLQALTGYLLSQKMQGTIKSKCEILRMRTERLAQKIEEVIQNSSIIEEMAKKVYLKSGFIFTGRGKYYPVALEGALKLKEVAYVHAEGYAAGELKHGPLALIDENMVNVAIIGPELYEKTLSNIEEVKARGGIILAIGSPKVKEILDTHDYCVPLELEDDCDFNAIYVNVITQLFAYYIAKFKGTDIDKPRNLAKSVTVE